MMAREQARQYLGELKGVLDRVPLEAFERFLALLEEAYVRGRQVFVMGNGGSAATASHFANDLNKGVSFGLPKRFRVICLNDNIPIMLAYANDVSYEDVFVEQLKNFLNEGDVVIGFSGSGNSRNVIKAIEYANGRGAQTVGLLGFEGGKLAPLVHLPVVVPVPDQQKAEDVHFILCHISMRILCDRVRSSIPGADQP